jgi:hypothetical protein
MEVAHMVSFDINGVELLVASLTGTVTIKIIENA